MVYSLTLQFEFGVNFETIAGSAQPGLASPNLWPYWCVHDSTVSSSSSSGIKCSDGNIAFVSVIKAKWASRLRGIASHVPIPQMTYTGEVIWQTSLSCRQSLAVLHR